MNPIKLATEGSVHVFQTVADEFVRVFNFLVYIFVWVPIYGLCVYVAWRAINARENSSDLVSDLSNSRLVQFFSEWIPYIYWRRINRVWIQRSHYEETPYDFKNSTREQRLNEMARRNMRFYDQDLISPLTYLVSPMTRYIRLIKIEPGKFDDPLHCSVAVEQLKDNLNFVAVSYAWGDWGENDLTVTLNGREGFRMTRNAHYALRRVREAGETRRLWIDSICIDQSNPKEKSEQVLLMNKIYERAWRVYIYLGPCHSPTSTGNEASDEERTKCSLHSTASIETIDVARSGGSAWLKEPAPELKWWRRAWTVQEAVVAKRVKVLLGPHHFSWETLCAIADVQGVLPPDVATSIGEVDRLRHRWSSRERRGLPLSELLLNTASREAGWAVDRVFSILPMMEILPHYLESIVPDYQMKAESLDVEVSRYILTQENSFDILLMGSWATHHSRDSYALKFTSRPLDRKSPLHSYSELTTGHSPNAGTRWKPRITKGLQFMQFGQGIVFDEIVAWDHISLQSFESAGEEERNQKIAAHLHDLAKGVVKQNSKEIRTSQGSLRFSNDHADEWNLGIRMQRAKHEGAVRKVATYFRSEEDKLLKEFHLYARQYAEGNHFFVTRLGFVGMAYTFGDPTDGTRLKVVVVGGAKMPFVLQAEGPFAGCRRGYFIGAAYVSCIMHNELIIATDSKAFKNMFWQEKSVEII